MAGKLYALLVGINDYPERVGRLRGCVNDVKAWAELLKQRVEGGGELELLNLTDAQATRAGIIEGFRSHLGRAGVGDTALFFFSGHGSQEPAPPPFDAEEPDGKCETLLAWDSRLPGGWDLADKELAVLIAEAAAGGAHVVVILDSCHSGTATRDDEEEGLVRRARGREEPRPVESFWFWQEESLLPGLDEAGGWRVLPRGPHVLLAACEDYQKAKEAVVGGGMEAVHRGAFSYFLLQALGSFSHDREVSYREVFKEAQIRVSNFCSDQCPDAEGELARRLFDGSLACRPATFSVRRRKDGEWRLDAGSVHGLAGGTELAVLPAGARDLADLSARVATVRLTEVGAGESRLEVTEGALPAERPAYPAVVSRLPLSPLRVAVHQAGARRGGSTRRTRLGRELGSSPFFELAGEPEAATLVVEEEGGLYHLRRPGSGDLTRPLPASAEGRRQLRGALEHVARWQTLAELDNPGSPLAEALELALWEWLAPPPGPGEEPELKPLESAGELLLPYREEAGGGEATPRRFAARLRNRSEQDLYFALFALEETFAVRLLRNAWGRLEAGRMLFLGREDGIPARVPDRYYDQGVTRRRDLLLLLVSEAGGKPDFSLIEQGRLLDPYDHPGRGWRSEGPPEVLEALMWRVGWREVDDEPRPLLAHKWAARRQAIVAERPQPFHALDRQGGEVSLAAGMDLQVPAGLGGTVRLHNAPSAHRRCPALGSPAGLQGQRLQPVSLAGRLGSDPGLSVLELKPEDPGAVTPERPLVIETDLGLETGEVLAAVVCDGRRSELVNPEPGQGPGPATSCRLPRLPVPASEDGAVWLELYALAPQG